MDTRQSDVVVGRSGARFPSAARRREWSERQAAAALAPVAPVRAAPRFDGALRGYDRHQVDDHIAALHREIAHLSDRLADSELRRVHAERGAAAAEEELAQHIAAADADARYRNDSIVRAALRATDRVWADPPADLGTR